MILTGTGSDGTLGLREVKAKGGVILVQDPNEAEYDGMPQSAIATGLVDRILPLAEIPGVLLRLATVQTQLKGELDADQDTTPERVVLPKITAILKARTERDFSRYKAATLLRRIARRMQLNYLDDFGTYLDRLREHPEEARALADDLLITVTSFFRDPDVFEKLVRDVVPHLFEGKGPGETIRIWSVGCATGEEAYSLAMVLLEEAARRENPPKIQVFASDLHKRSLESAREGLYPGDIQTDLTPERLKRFFQQENGGYRICKEVRDVVVFAPHNLLSDPPFSRLDLITCRNLLIYLERAVQRDVIDLFHYALCPNGVLLLGSAETVDAMELFRTEDKKLCIYRKRNVPVPEPRLPVFPLTRFRVGTGPAPSVEPAPLAIPYQSLHQNLLERFAPPSMLVGPDNRLVHSSEHAGRYLMIPGGETTLSALRLVREELRIELQALLQAARDGKDLLDSRPIPVRFNGHSAPVVMHVRPAQDADQEGFVLVIFEEHQSISTTAITTTSQPGEGSDQSAARVQELEAELSTARQRMQATIEEYETSREEMKASHEEMQSTNEELRSTMEELETSKEELQSINEELQTVNQENRHKVEELSQLSSDLQNLLSATDIATLFLDRELRILRFTPRLADLFNIRVTDRGRPISDLTHRLGYAQLRDDARIVLERLIPVDREIRDEADRWYLTRVLPYRSTDDRIEGVVITFVDITARKKTEQALRESETLRRVALTGGRMGTWSWDLAAGMVSGDAQFMALWGFPPSSDSLPLSLFTERMSPEGSAEMERIVTTAIASEEEFDGPLEIASGPNAGNWVQWRGRAGGDGSSVLYGVTFDITGQQKAESQLRESEERKAVLLELSDALNRLTDPIAIQQAAMKILAEHLNLSRAFYFRVEREEDSWAHVVDSEYVRVAGLKSMVGRHSLQRFRAQLFEQLANGTVLQVDDVTALAGILPEELASYKAVGVAAFVNVPLRRSAEYNAGITAHDVVPREWTRSEIETMREVGERTWAAVERARAETALAESEKRYRALFEEMSDGYCLGELLRDETGKATDWRYILMNPALERHTGMSAEASTGRWFGELFPGTDRSYWLAVFQSVVDTQTPHSFENYWQPIDRWLAGTASPASDGRYTIVSQDVSERKRAELALQESEASQRGLLEGIPQLVWRSKDDGFWTWSSPQWQSFTGQDHEDSKGRGWLRAVHPDDRQAAVEAWHDAREKGSMEVDYRVRQEKSGLYRYHHTRSVPIRDQEGRILEWLGTSTDIEDLKQAEVARQTVEEQFRLFVDNVREYGLVQTDAAGVIANWNPGAERLFGFSPTEMIGKSFEVLMTDEDRMESIFMQELAYVTEGHRNEDARWFVRRDGSRFWARWITEPIQSPEGKFLGLAKIMRDETERERAADFTKTALAEKEELLKEVHHRVKNNLQVITSLLNLQADRIADEKTLIAFDEARNRVSSIAAIHELLYRSSSLAAIHLADYAQALTPTLLSFYGMQDRVAIEILGDGVTVELERAVPYGLLLNELVSNALKHAFPDGRHGKIQISFASSENMITLRMAENGIGLPGDFDLEKATSLGLRLVRGLASQLRGSVVFEKVSVGTSIEVQFPNIALRRT